MPFQSEKQRRYLWANEPEIARDWSDKYGSRVKKNTGGITRIPFANGSVYPLNILGSEVIPPDAYKENIMNQYQDIAKQKNLTYEDSPIFNRGLEAWDPYSLGSQTLQNWSIPVGNFFGSFADDPSVTYGGAGVIGTRTSAGFKNDLLNKVKSGAATEAEKLQFARTFGHEMSHLGMTYKPRNELINVPGVGEEGGKLAAMLGGIRLPKFLQDKIPGLPGEYEGEEQWNRMHDLMYGGTTDWRKNLADLKGTYQSLPAKSPERKEAYKKAMTDHLVNTQKYNPGVAESFLRDAGLIAADKSYTPYGHEKIGWSGLTSESKKALGFGVNPHEDTMMGRMRSYPNAPMAANYPDAIMKGQPSLTAEDEDDTQSGRNLGKYIPHGLRAYIGNKLGLAGGLPGMLFSGLTGGMGNFANTMRGGLTQRGYEQARDARRKQSRIDNMLARKVAGKSYSQKNLNQLLGQNGGVNGGTGSPGGGAQAAGDLAGGSALASPFNRGGLATLWPR